LLNQNYPTPDDSDSMINIARRGCAGEAKKKIGPEYRASHQSVNRQYHGYRRNGTGIFNWGFLT